MKEQLIQYLQSKTTVFTVEELNGVINLISQLEEPKEEPKKKKDGK